MQVPETSEMEVLSCMMSPSDAEAILSVQSEQESQVYISALAVTIKARNANIPMRKAFFMSNP